MTRLCFIALLFLAGQADALPMPQVPQCAPRAKLIYEMADKYLEMLVWHGIAQNGAMIERYENPKTGTWTMLVTVPSDTKSACVLLTGQAGEVFPYETGEPS